jgi:hypothetical protein
MPLSEGAKALILKNLMKIHRNRTAYPVTIGYLTDVQLSMLNAERAGRNFKAMTARVLFVGAHIYESRVRRDGYSFDDVITQIEGALHETAVFTPGPSMSQIVSCTEREDGYGNRVIDTAVLGCDSKYPHSELYSIIPKRDHNKPKPKKKEQATEAQPVPENSTNPPG